MIIVRLSFRDVDVVAGNFMLNLLILNILVLTILFCIHASPFFSSCV